MRRTVYLKLITLIFFQAFSILLLSSQLYAEKIVAIVNRDTITKKELNDFKAFMYFQFAREAGEDEAAKKTEALEPDLLAKLIEDRLILQEAKKENIQIDPRRIKDRVDEIKKRYPSELAFQSELLKQGLSQADIENKIQDQMLMYMMIEQKVRSKIVVRPDEITGFYNLNKDKFNTPEAKELEAYIFDNKVDATLFSYNIRAGKKLEELAARYPFTVEKLKTSANEELKKEIADVVSSLGLNQYSEQVKIDQKFYVFRLVNIIPPNQQSLAQVQDKINAFLFEKKMQEDAAKWVAELKKNSYIKILKD
jgi:peptidyl-prolyl cis-trans isomerase SurA